MGEDRDCRQCFFTQSAAVKDIFFQKAVQPYAWIAAVALSFSYVIGLWFTLRTHAALIWAEHDEKKDPYLSGLLPEASGAIRDAQTNYKRAVNRSLRHIKSNRPPINTERGEDENRGGPPHLVPPSAKNDVRRSPYGTPGLEDQADGIVAHMAAAEITAASLRDAARNRKAAGQQSMGRHTGRFAAEQAGQAGEEYGDSGTTAAPAQASGGHDAPNWSKTKSSIILLGSTILYAIIAEILVDTVDVVLESVDIDEKFLGITLFALVPNTTEFLVRQSPLC